LRPVLVRPAVPADVPVLAQLRWEFRTAAAEPVEDRAGFEARFRERVGRALAGGSWRAWVAELPEGSAGAQDGIVGHVYAARVDKLPNPVDEPESHLYVSNLYVRPTHRGRGIGTALLAAALDLALAAADGTDAAILWAWPGSAGLYARHGFGPSPEILERRPVRR